MKSKQAVEGNDKTEDDDNHPTSEEPFLQEHNKHQVVDQVEMEELDQEVQTGEDGRLFYIHGRLKVIIIEKNPDVSKPLPPGAIIDGYGNAVTTMPIK